MRVACCRVSDLPLAAELRANPEIAGRPLAVASGPGPRAELVAVSPEAARLGVRRLDGVAHARAVCAELEVCLASPARERAAREALLDAALAVSPRAALAAPVSGAWSAEACAFADASGVEALFRSETGFATALLGRAERLGFRAAVAIASSQSVARIAARRLRAGRLQVLPPDGEAAFLAPLPIDLLDPDDPLAETLGRFGVRCVRDLLRLPRRALATRLGPEALELVALARGRATTPPLPPAPPARLLEATDLEFAVDRLEPLCFVLQGVLSRLLARLEARHLACGELTLRLDLEGGGRDARRVGLAAPTLELRVLMRLLAHALEERPPAAPAMSAAIEVAGRALRSDQLDLFRPAGPAPSALGRTLAELQALCGRDRIGAPHPADDHRPHLFELRPFTPPREAECSTTARPPSLCTRALRPPVSAEVRLAGHRPVALRSAVASGAVVHLAGPWRTTGGWWTPESRYAYDYFDVLTSDGTISRLRFDHVSRCWAIDAVYD